jgi:hypothetical protein
MAPLAPLTAATRRRLGSSLTIRAMLRQVLFVVKDRLWCKYSNQYYDIDIKQYYG